MVINKKQKEGSDSYLSQLVSPMGSIGPGHPLEDVVPWTAAFCSAVHNVFTNGCISRSRRKDKKLIIFTKVLPYIERKKAHFLITYF